MLAPVPAGIIKAVATNILLSRTQLSTAVCTNLLTILPTSQVQIITHRHSATPLIPPFKFTRLGVSTVHAINTVHTIESVNTIGTINAVAAVLTIEYNCRSFHFVLSLFLINSIFILSHKRH
jgi:hypothetical protein